MMIEFRFNKGLYPKIALLKAAYNFTDRAYIHLDQDDNYYAVFIEAKPETDDLNEDLFKNEMLTQSLRHEVYLQTKNIRELLMARAMATTVVADTTINDDNLMNENFTEDEILKDWFADNDNTRNQ